MADTTHRLLGIPTSEFQISDPKLEIDLTSVVRQFEMLNESMRDIKEGFHHGWDLNTQELEEGLIEIKKAIEKVEFKPVINSAETVLSPEIKVHYEQPNFGEIVQALDRAVSSLSLAFKLAALLQSALLVWIVYFMLRFMHP